MTGSIGGSYDEFMNDLMGSVWGTEPYGISSVYQRVIIAEGVCVTWTLNASHLKVVRYVTGRAVAPLVYTFVLYADAFYSFTVDVSWKQIIIIIISDDSVYFIIRRRVLTTQVC